MSRVYMYNSLMYNIQFSRLPNVKSTNPTVGESPKGSSETPFRKLQSLQMHLKAQGTVVSTQWLILLG